MHIHYTERGGVATAAQYPAAAAASAGAWAGLGPRGPAAGAAPGNFAAADVRYGQSFGKNVLLSLSLS